MESDPSKSRGQYSYEKTVDLLCSGVATKYKKNNGDLIQDVNVTLTKDPKTEMVNLSVQLVATKNSILNSIILPKQSTVKVMPTSNKNLNISAFTMNKENAL